MWRGGCSSTGAESGGLFLESGYATGGYDLLRSDSCSASDEYKLQVAAQSIDCPITIVQGSDAHPTEPSITTAASCQVGTAFSLSFSSTDPNGHQLKYSIDWDNDGSVDQYAPSSGFVNSGVTQTASRTYSTNGQKTIGVIAQNDQGAISSSATYTFSCNTNACPIGYTLQGTACVFSACPSGYKLEGTQCVVSN